MQSQKANKEPIIELDSDYDSEYEHVELPARDFAENDTANPLKPIMEVDDMDFEVIEDTQKKLCPISKRRANLLEEWRKVTKYGKLIEGTNILPAKTPMARRRWTDHTPREDQFRVVQMIEELKKEGKNVAAVVDLNRNDSGYYSWDYNQWRNKELLGKIDYRKIKIGTKEIGNKTQLNKVYDVLNKNAFKKDQIVVVHCTRGINRTGHAVCYFLCKRFELTPEEAIRRFNEARGYPIDKKDIIEDLYDRFG